MAETDDETASLGHEGMSWWNLAAVLVVIWIASKVLSFSHPLLNLSLIIIAVLHSPVLYVTHHIKAPLRRG